MLCRLRSINHNRQRYNTWLLIVSPIFPAFHSNKNIISNKRFDERNCPRIILFLSVLDVSLWSLAVHRLKRKIESFRNFHLFYRWILTHHGNGCSSPVISHWHDWIWRSCPRARCSKYGQHNKQHLADHALHLQPGLSDGQLKKASAEVFKKKKRSVRVRVYYFIWTRWVNM